LRAWALKEAGWKQKDIAAALGVTEGAVSHWLRRGREGGGVAALRRRTSPGAPSRLRPEQREQIPALLARGPEAYGFAGAVWTTPRVAEVLARVFGVRYHPAHVSRLLRQLRSRAAEARGARHESATRQPSPPGRQSAGPRSKTGRRRAAHHHLGR
jgi:transposase